MAYTQIVALLSRSPCASIEKQNETDVNKNCIKRDVTAGSIDIHALQTTFNDHRTMIEYLINNAINATFVAEAINNHHSPNWSNIRQQQRQQTPSLATGSFAKTNTTSFTNKLYFG
jgi:hypothetical protein